MKRIVCRQAARAAVVMWLGFAVSACSYTTVREHPDFASNARPVESVAVVSPDVEFLLLVFTGENERQPEDERRVTTTMLHSLPRHLLAKGYKVTKFDAEQLQVMGPDTSFALQQLRTAYDEASKQLYERQMVSEDESKKFRVNVGPIVNHFATTTGVDALLISRYRGFKKSGGMVAKDMAASVLLTALTGTASVAPTNGGAVEVALLDARSGDVLWANNAGGNVNADFLVKQVLAKMPARSRVPVPDSAAAEPAATPAAAPAGAGDGAAP